MEKPKAIDPWETFMRAITGSDKPVYVCGYFDGKGEMQIKANGKLLNAMALSGAVLEFFKIQLANTVDHNKESLNH